MNIEDVGNLSKYMSEYGPLIVILSVFLIIFAAMIYYSISQNKKYHENQDKRTDDESRRNDELIKNILERNNQMVTSILDDYTKKNERLLEERQHKKEYDEKNIVEIYNKLQGTLKNVCELTMNKSHSNRTAIYVFHNGTHASHGMPFFKLTCISEKVTKDSNSNILISDHSAMSLNMFDSIVTSLFNNGEYRIITSQTTNPSDLMFVKGTKIKDSFFTPIYDSENIIMGFIYNGYNTLDPNRDMEIEKKFLSELAMMASPVIEYSKFQEYQSNHNHDEKEV